MTHNPRCTVAEAHSDEDCSTATHTCDKCAGGDHSTCDGYARTWDRGYATLYSCACSSRGHAPVDSPVPGHIRTANPPGNFCSREGQMAPGGRCPDGCDHADHYSNDGHPECEDLSGLPTRAGGQP